MYNIFYKKIIMYFCQNEIKKDEKLIRFQNWVFNNFFNPIALS